MRNEMPRQVIESALEEARGAERHIKEVLATENHPERMCDLFGYLADVRDAIRNFEELLAPLG